MAEDFPLPMVDEPADTPEAQSSYMQDATIGIDLGTWSSSAAVYRNGRVEILHKDMPSHVLFADDRSLTKVGTATDDELWSGRAVFDVKKLIGRTDADPIMPFSRKYPFLVECLGIGLRPYLGALCNGLWRSTTSEEVLAIQLVELREMVEAQLGRAVRTAVVTVPVSFSRFQLTRIERACNMAGIPAVRLMPEPAAVALVYAQAVQQQVMLPATVSGERVGFVLSMGAAYTDAAVVTTDGGVSQVRGLAGEVFGADDLLQNLVDYLLPEVLPELGPNPSKQVVALATGRLRSAARQAMHALSSELDATVTVELPGGHTFTRNVTRDVFNDLNREVFERCLRLIVNCIRDAELEPNSITDVIAIGGGSNVPGIQEVLRKVFGPNKIQIPGMDHMEAVVHGAALEGAIMSGLTDPNGSLDLLTIQAMPLSVGISISGGKFLKVLKKNSTIPANRDVVLTTCKDNQHEALIAVYEGESDMVKDNHLLGLFKLSGLPQAQKGVPLVRICMDVDASNVLRVVAGAGLPDSEEVITGLREVRMPTVDDGHDWCVEALWKKFEDSMDLTTL